MNVSDQIEALFETVAAAAAAEAGRPAVTPVDFHAARDLITGAVLREFDRMMTHRAAPDVDAAPSIEELAVEEQSEQDEAPNAAPKKAAKVAEPSEPAQPAAEPVAEPAPEPDETPDAEAAEQPVEGGAA